MGIRFAFLLSTLIIANIQAVVIGKINDKNVRLRSEPSTNSEILLITNTGDEVEVLGNENEYTIEGKNIYCWLKIKHKESTGYIFSKYINSNYIYTLKEEAIYFTDTGKLIGYESPVYSSDAAMLLFNNSLIVEKQIEKNVKLMTVCNNIYSVPKEYEDVFYRPFIVYNNAVHRMVLLLDDNSYYFAFEDALSFNTIEQNNMTYYLKRTYSPIKIKDEIIVSSMTQFIQLEKNGARVIYSNTQDFENGLFHNILGVSVTKEYVMVHEERTSSISKTDYVNTFILAGNRMNKIAEFIIYHYEE